jgi:hypothetical protein
VGVRREGERTFRNGDMLEEQDDYCNRKLSSEGGDQSRVDIGGPNVLESSRNGAQDPDRVFAFGINPVTAVKPGGKGKDDHNKGIPQN